MQTFLGLAMFIALIALIAVLSIVAAPKSSAPVVLHRGPVLRASKDGVEILEDK